MRLSRFKSRCVFQLKKFRRKKKHRNYFALFEQKKKEKKRVANWLPNQLQTTQISNIDPESFIINLCATWKNAQPNDAQCVWNNSSVKVHIFISLESSFEIYTKIKLLYRWWTYPKIIIKVCVSSQDQEWIREKWKFEKLSRKKRIWWGKTTRTPLSVRCMMSVYRRSGHSVFLAGCLNIIFIWYIYIFFVSPRSILSFLFVRMKNGHTNVLVNVISLRASFMRANRNFAIIDPAVAYGSGPTYSRIHDLLNNTQNQADRDHSLSLSVFASRRRKTWNITYQLLLLFRFGKKVPVRERNQLRIKTIVIPKKVQKKNRQNE